jgi:hypothetical protein
MQLSLGASVYITGGKRVAGDGYVKVVPFRNVVDPVVLLRLVRSIIGSPELIHFTPVPISWVVTW